MIELIQLDLPAPVAPATRRCGIFARFAQTDPPSTSLLPRPTTIGWWLDVAAVLRMTSPRLTSSRSERESRPMADHLEWARGFAHRHCSHCIRDVLAQRDALNL